MYSKFIHTHIYLDTYVYGHIQANEKMLAGGTSIINKVLIVVILSKINLYIFLSHGFLKCLFFIVSIYFKNACLLCSYSLRSHIYISLICEHISFGPPVPYSVPGLYFGGVLLG